MFKYLEPIKTFNLDDETAYNILDNSYLFYKDNILNYQLKENKNFAMAFSAFLRFLKSVNSSKKIDEEFFQNYLKNEALKGKPKTISKLNELINEIKLIQSSRILFNSNNYIGFSQIPLKEKSFGKNYKYVNNFDFKIDVNISSNFNNRMLSPEIYFIFTFEEGSILKIKVDLRMFNEIRKNLSLNIKKILFNENVALLK